VLLELLVITVQQVLVVTLEVMVLTEILVLEAQVVEADMDG
jgi:hypothetical protein